MGTVFRQAGRQTSPADRTSNNSTHTHTSARMAAGSVVDATHAFGTDGLADYLPFLCPNGDGAILILTGYFDESERQEAAEPICVGGYLFKQTGYKQFHRYWRREVLRFHGHSFPHFHMTDLCAGRQEYDGLSIPDRQEILSSAVAGITRFAYGGIAIYFDRAEFEAVAPAEWPKYRGSIYSTACHMCLQATASWLRKWGSGSKVLYVFERGTRCRLRPIPSLPQSAKMSVPVESFGTETICLSGKVRRPVRLISAGNRIPHKRCRKSAIRPVK